MVALSWEFFLQPKTIILVEFGDVIKDFLDAKKNLINVNRSNTYTHLFLLYSQNYTIYTHLKCNKK